jgi:hypothetical protein
MHPVLLGHASPIEFLLHVWKDMICCFQMSKSQKSRHSTTAIAFSTYSDGKVAHTSIHSWPGLLIRSNYRHRLDAHLKWPKCAPKCAKKPTYSYVEPVLGDDVMTSLRQPHNYCWRCDQALAFHRVCSICSPSKQARKNQETRDKRAATQQEGERKKARTTKEPLKGVARMFACIRDRKMSKSDYYVTLCNIFVFILWHMFDNLTSKIKNIVANLLNVDKDKKILSEINSCIQFVWNTFQVL